MAYFDDKLWRAVGERLRQMLPPNIDRWAMDNGLAGVRLDRIIKGRKGTSVETLVTICQKADISPAWLLFGVGPKRLVSLTREVPDNGFDIAAERAGHFGGKKKKALT